jgi:glycosyltransferase involved in cell wall biosynthesis
MAESIRRRDRALRERLVPAVDHFYAPSRFLRERMLEWGIPADQISQLKTGIDVSRFERHERTRAEILRVVFIGTLAPHKGAHVLLDAWGRVPAGLRTDARLSIYGPHTHNPAYLRHLQSLSAKSGARLEGELPRDAVNEVLHSVDLLVVPSVWYENRPLIILEALATHTPLLVSDLGGMAELVEPGQSGFHFKVGDADDLARTLSGLLEDRAWRDELYPDGAPEALRDIRDDAAFLEGVYTEAVRAKGERGA